MASSSSGSGPGPRASPPATSATAGSPEGGRLLLRAARRDRGWSQAVAARELSALAARTGATVAGPASLKTQLSRWENGHATPEPEYRTLLGTLYDRDPAGLGLADAREPAASGDPADALSGALAEADALDDTALALHREQIDVAARLDHRLGPAGAADVLAAQVDRLAALADHVLPEEVRRDVCTLLADAALLAGDLDRDRGRTSTSWSRYGTARAAALEAGRPDLAARARAGRATLLVDAGEPDRARALLGDAADEWSALVRSEAGRTVDAVRPGITVDVGPIRHRREIGSTDTARDALERAAADRSRPVRERAEASAVLARALQRDGHTADAVAHARRAHLLALRIGAPRIAALVAEVLTSRA